jgi:hypothetical protein
MSTGRREEKKNERAAGRKIEMEQRSEKSERTKCQKCAQGKVDERIKGRRMLRFWIQLKWLQDMFP